MVKTRSLISRLLRGLVVASFLFAGFQTNVAGAARAVEQGVQPLAPDGTSFYYYADGQRIALQASLSWVSVKFASPEASKRSAALRGAPAPLGSLDQARHIPEPELTLLPVQAGTSVQSLVQGIDAMRAAPSGFQEVNPVFQADDVELIPSDEFIATFAPGKSLDEIQALNAALGTEIVGPVLGQENSFVLKVLPEAGADALSMANYYQESGAALTAAPNFVRIVHGDPAPASAAQPTAAGPLVGANDPLYSDQWFLNETNQYGSFMNGADADIDAPEAWNLTTGSPAVIIAVIDEGVDRNHEDLSTKMVGGYDATARGSGGSPEGNDAHGTAVAGIAAAVSNNSKGVAGVCQGCRIMPVRIAYEDSNGDWVTTDAKLAEGITWAYQHGAWILNNSWKAGPPSTTITTAINNAKIQGRGGRGAVVVFSAGNDNASTVSYPGSLPAVIGVGASNLCDQRKTNENTACNNNETLWGSNYGTELDVSAPGVLLDTTDIMGNAGYDDSNSFYGADYDGFFNGTSGAAPVVSGIAGLILSANPYLTADEVQTILQNTADDIGPGSGKDLETGYGRVNANRAVQLALASFTKDTTGVFRPSNGLLYLKNSNNTGFADAALNYGLSGDYPVVGDWDGNGTVTIGVYRNAKFYLRNSNTIGFADLTIPFGVAGDQPIAGDWDGNGTDTIGLFRPSTAAFYLRNSNSPGDPQISFALGNAGDVGIAGDWNGDGMDTTGVFRPSNGVIFLKNNNSTGFADVALNYGVPGDKPVTGDWDGNGTDTIGVYRGNTFYLRNSNTVGFANMIFALGNPGDMPIAGNWDGIP